MVETPGAGQLSGEYNNFIEERFTLNKIKFSDFFYFYQVIIFGLIFHTVALEHPILL
jgi:hypothetical protein